MSAATIATIEEPGSPSTTEGRRGKHGDDSNTAIHLAQASQRPFDLVVLDLIRSLRIHSEGSS
jgi:hypothetical protein